MVSFLFCGKSQRLIQMMISYVLVRTCSRVGSKPNFVLLRGAKLCVSCRQVLTGKHTAALVGPIPQISGGKKPSIYLIIQAIVHTYRCVGVGATWPFVVVKTTQSSFKGSRSTQKTKLF